MDYGSYHHLLFERRDHGVLLITMNRPEVYNAADEAMHSQLATVWTDVARDDETRVAVITGAGKAFSAGGDLAMVAADGRRLRPDHADAQRDERPRLQHGQLRQADRVGDQRRRGRRGPGGRRCWPTSASARQDARLGDGHVKLGAAAGDHAAIIWPLLCGMAKARYHLLTGEMVDGVEAERIGLVSKVLPRDEVLDEALRVADTLATGSQLAIRLTKRALNSWLRTAGPIFDQSAAYEMLTFMGPDLAEGAAALREKRPPKFA